MMKKNSNTEIHSEFRNVHFQLLMQVLKIQMTDFKKLIIKKLN